jgi:hypothetical protein
VSFGRQRNIIAEAVFSLLQKAGDRVHEAAATHYVHAGSRSSAPRNEGLRGSRLERFRQTARHARGGGEADARVYAATDDAGGDGAASGTESEEGSAVCSRSGRHGRRLEVSEREYKQAGN